MARQPALNIADYTTPSVMDNLAEILDGVIENIQVSAVSEALKSKRGSGTPVQGGSIEYKRFANAQLKAKGTARAAGAGDKVKAKPVIVNIDDDKEIIEELQEKDIRLYGIDGMAERRKENFRRRIEAYLDRAFFTEAVSGGTAHTTTKTELKDILDEMIVAKKETQSDFIDGIDAEDLAIVLNGTARKTLKNDLDSLPNGTKPENGAIGAYDSIVVYESNRLPQNVDMIVMLKESVAQPWLLSDYAPEKVPFDDAIALENFVYSGRKTLVPEGILYHTVTI